MMMSALTVPVKTGDASGAKRLRADCVAVEIGFAASLVLLTLPNPTMAAVIPDTVPVKAGDAKGALRSRAACVAVEIGFAASLVLLTLPRPTMAAVIPETVPVKCGAFKGASADREVWRSELPSLMVEADKAGMVAVGACRSILMATWSPALSCVMAAASAVPFQSWSSFGPLPVELVKRNL